MSEQDKKKAVQSRRGFLKGAGVASVATALSVLCESKTEASEVAAEDLKSGYQKTDHVNAYYEAAKF